MVVLYPDQAMRDAIARLLKEEHRLHQNQTLSESDHRRFREIHVELDGYLAALRERRSLEKARQDRDPRRARPRTKDDLRSV
jgi:hypothetical protein